MTAKVSDYQGWEAVTVSNEHLTLIIIPSLGGKIASLRASTGDTEWLWQDQSRPYRTPLFGDDFGNYDASGWDECFPTIGECAYPEVPWVGVPMADHGELWCVPWRYDIVDPTTLHLHTYGIRFGYHFERWISLEDDGGVLVRYRVENLTPFPLKAIWSAHPLFAAEEGMRVVIPGAPPMRVAHAMGGRITGDIHDDLRWPTVADAHGQFLDYGTLDRPDLDANDKVFVDAPADGWCALHRPRTGEYLGFSFRVADIPVIGVCINHGGYPPTGERGYWVAVEPCWGWPDRLDDATTMGVHATLDGWASREWALGIHLGIASDEKVLGAQLATDQRPK